MNYSAITRLISSFANVSKNLQDKLNENHLLFVNQLQVLSDEDLANQYHFTAEEIREINEKIKFSFRNIGPPIAAGFLDQDIEYIRTGSRQFDRVLSPTADGLPTSRLTQVFGEAGAGKSQFCLQICFRVQLSVQEGGLKAEALYIDTESCFRPERIVQIAKDYFRIDQNKAEECLQRVHVRNVNTTADDLIDLIVNGRLDAFLDDHKNVRLLVLDSIAYHFRYFYEEDNDTKTRQLNQIAIKLKQISFERNIAVSKDKDLPALDNLWNAASSTVLLLMRPPVIIRDDGDTSVLQPSVRKCFVIKSTTVKPGTNFKYLIDESGIKDFS